MEPSFSRADFEQLLGEHQRLIELANDLEYQLYRLGEQPGGSPAAACQQAAGALLGRLRDVLFRHDQQVFPLLDALSADHGPVVR
jgi:hypothetical protein